MSSDPVETVIGYHDRTKHHPNRYARSLGYLDWATQPDPFRRFEGTPLLKLPIPADREAPSYADLFSPGAVPSRPLNAESVSTFFYLSLALSAWKEAGPSRWALRVNPSSGNLHPTEGYAVLPAVEGFLDGPAVCHYAPREHALEVRSRPRPDAYSSLVQSLAGPDAPPSFCFLVGLSSIYWREAWKYGERAFRYCNHDVGHALAALRMAAAFLGWRLVVLEDLGDGDVARLLGLDRDDDFQDAEREQPDLLAAVLPGDCEADLSLGVSPEAINAAVSVEWFGRANRLSPDHVDWDVIDAAHEATHKPARPGRRVRLSAGSGAAVPTPGVSAFKLIRTRRSALSFDGRTCLGADKFFSMLSRVMPGATSREGVRSIKPPWDCVQWPPRVHLFLFVHLVEGLAPGVYALIRDPARVDEMKRACDSEFGWAVPAGTPEALPLLELVRADCRRAAAQLSLGQDIAGMSAFSLGMVARFDETLREEGAWAYRRLFWEAGMIGQSLYLEAEAVGLRATGIGAYFDDLVHETLGLADHRFQSLYHFTIGGAVEDLRILTGPAYPV